MHSKKTIIIICAIIALCAIIYLAPSSRKAGEPPKPATTGLQKQRVKNTEAPPKAVVRPQKQRVRSSSEADNATTEAVQPREVPRPITRSTPTTIDGDASSPAEDLKAQELEKRMQEFKGKYEWDEPATMNIAEHLIGIIPEQFRDSGITAMIKNLDEAQQQGGSSAVDELMVLQSAEKMMPEKFRPQLQEIIEKYKAEHGGRR